jgi:hypothetical protein
MKTIALMFKQVQNTAKQNGIVDVNSMDNLVEAPDEFRDFLKGADEMEMNSSACGHSDSKDEDNQSIESNQQDMKLVEFVIDLLFKIIQNNQKSIQEVFADPMVLVNLLTNPSKFSDLSKDITEQIEQVQLVGQSKK